MSKLKKTLLDTSLFRRSYIICLFCGNISFVLIPAYVVLIFLFLWGLFLLVYNEVKHHTVLKTRYGAWLLGFVVTSLVTVTIHLADSVLYNVYNLIMVLHVAMCFFIFYSVHTEKHLNFRRELYSVCKFIVYTTTVLGIAGLVFLMAEISFEVLWQKFIVFDNRFDGMFINPNQTGFIAVVGIFCSHMLLKKDFIAISGRERVSRIWIGSCVAVNAISLLLCDSNGAMVLMIGYAVFFVIYKMFGSESRFTLRQIVTKSAACLLAGVVIIASLFFVRNITQAGFVQIMKSAKPVVLSNGITEMIVEEEAVVTFEHENKNLDSGRFKLWKQAAKMFLEHPILGIGKGNIYEYGNRMFEDGIRFSKSYGILAPILTDFHNGYITILICSGVVGLVLFCIFGLRFFKHITMHVFRDDSLKESVLPCMYSFLCAYAIYSFIEVGLLFNVNFMVLFFWLILGYTSCFLVKYEPDRTLGTFVLFGRTFRKTLY
ncbi:MAG: O-antigen ligase family protein [Ruminococcus sp.]|nr:O-antigen ligase family protein [Ruminococcus sp.]